MLINYVDNLRYKLSFGLVIVDINTFIFKCYLLSVQFVLGNISFVNCCVNIVQFSGNKSTCFENKMVLSYHGLYGVVLVVGYIIYCVYSTEPPYRHTDS